MKQIILGVVIVLLSVYSAWAVSLVSDPLPAHVGAAYEIWSAAKNQTDNNVVSTGTIVTIQNMEADGSVKYVIDYLSPGSFNWYVRAWGYPSYTYTDATGKLVTVKGGTKEYSIFVPFSFAKTAAPSTGVQGVKLAP